jgi:hypothetical protein
MAGAIEQVVSLFERELRAMSDAAYAKAKGYT